MKKKLSIVILTILISIFAFSYKVNATSIDLSKYTSEDLVDALATEGVTNPDLTKYNIPNSKRVNIYIFRADGCKNCKNLYTNYIANKLLNTHGDKIKIITYEIRNNKINYGLLDAAKALLNEQAGSYDTPMVFIGNKTFSGDLASSDASVPQKQVEMEKAIDALYNSSNRYDILEELSGKKVFTENTTNITLTSDTRLNRDYTLKATQVDNKAITLGEGYTYIVSYDISMYDAGNNIVPLTNGSYKIKIPVNVAYDTYKVGYVKDGKIQEEFNATYANNYIEFTTTHLSEYVVYGFNNKKPDSNQDVNTDANQNKPEETKDSNIKQNTQIKNAMGEPNPQTFDNIQFYVVLLGLGSIILTISILSFKKKEN